MSNFERVIKRAHVDHSKRRRHHALTRRAHLGDVEAIEYLKKFHAAVANAKAKRKTA